jgi:RNA polymerase sigma-70 factor (ECF subfamily)
LSGAGDFDEFYRREYASVLALAFALCRDHGTAEELTQDGFAAAYRRWETVGGYDAPGAFVRRIVLNRSRSWWRRRGREGRALARVGVDETVEEGTASVDVDGFWRVVRSLPAMQARCVALRYVEDLDIAGIASVLDCAESTVRVHLLRARRTLAARLELEWHE